MQEPLSLLALDVVGVTAFGSHVPGSSMEAARDIYQTVARVAEMTIGRVLSGRSMLPMYRWGEGGGVPGDNEETS